MRQRDGLEPQTTGNSLDGSPAGSPPKSDFIDFFASVDVPQQAPSQPQNHGFGGQDPFMLEQQRLLQQQQMLQSQMMYQQQQQALQSFHSQPPNPPNVYMNSHNPFMNTSVVAPVVPVAPMNYQHSQPQQQQQFDSNNSNNPNMIKTNATIDPFASLAASRTHSVYLF